MIVADDGVWYLHAMTACFEIDGDAPGVVDKHSLDGYIPAEHTQADAQTGVFDVKILEQQIAVTLGQWIVHSQHTVGTRFPTDETGSLDADVISTADKAAAGRYVGQRSVVHEPDWRNCLRR